MPVRSTLNIKDLQFHIINNLHDLNGEAEEYESDEEDEEMIAVYMN